jgi:shikimate dehydrogenase
LRAARVSASIENLKSKIENPAAPVLTLGDLETWSFPGTALAVLGHPIGHSISPPMHNAALAGMVRADARFASWKYFRFDVPPADLPRALALLHAKKFRGVNLTVPHKILAVGLVAAVDPSAHGVGAVNTLLRTEAGWRGFNTDGHGLATAIREDLGRELAGAHVLLLGAGGAARGAAVECLRQGCASLSIANRSPENLTALLAALAPLPGNIPIRSFSPAAPPSDLPAGALVINATSLGLRAADPAPIDLAALPRPAAVFDMIYNPPQTALLRVAAALGVPHTNGLSMLVHQGARSLEIWTGSSVPVPAMRTAARAALGAA